MERMKKNDGKDGTFHETLLDPPGGPKIVMAGLPARRQDRAAAGEKGPKKIPSLHLEDWGFYPQAPFTVLSSKTFS